MTGKSHLSVGIGLGITTFVLNYESTNDFLYSSLICTGCIIGSLLPDIDSGKSMISQNFLFLPKLIKKIFGHRGFIKSLYKFICATLWSGIDNWNDIPFSIRFIY